MAGPRFLIGVDEAGRGPIAGPVAVAAVCWTLGVQHTASKTPSRQRKVVSGAIVSLPIRDSKRLSAKQREELFARIRGYKKQGKLDYAVALVGGGLIDKRGITAAIKIGIRRCLTRLGCPPDKCSVCLDGALRAPRQYSNQKTIIRGDETVPIIALASVVAKVVRDRYMTRVASRYPGYEFERHKGYGTKKHYQALLKHGLTPFHRLSFLRRWYGWLTKNT